MNEPVIARERISQEAEEAARAWAATPNAPRPLNPYPALSTAAMQWAADFERWLLAVSCPEGEGSA